MDGLTFTLTDADGETHQYHVTPHPPSDGEQIVWALMAAGAEPVVSMVSMVASRGGSLNDMMDLGFDEMFDGVDFSGLGKGLRSAILGSNMPKLRKALMRYTTRDGCDLGDPAEVNKAYTRNYFEMGHALWKIVELNRFFPLSAISDQVKTGGESGADSNGS